MLYVITVKIKLLSFELFVERQQAIAAWLGDVLTLKRLGQINLAQSQAT